MKFNQRLKVVNREGGGAGLVSGQFSAGLERPVPAQRCCRPPGIVIGPGTARGGRPLCLQFQLLERGQFFSVPHAKSIWQSQASLSPPFPP